MYIGTQQRCPNLLLRHLKYCESCWDHGQSWKVHTPCTWMGTELVRGPFGFGDGQFVRLSVRLSDMSLYVNVSFTRQNEILYEKYLLESHKKTKTIKFIDWEEKRDGCVQRKKSRWEILSYFIHTNKKKTDKNCFTAYQGFGIIINCAMVFYVGMYVCMDVGM